MSDEVHGAEEHWDGPDEHLVTRRRLLQSGAGAGALLAMGSPLDAFAIGQQKPTRGGRLKLGMDSGSAAETLYLPGATPWLVDYCRTYNLFDSLVRRKPDGTMGLQLAKSLEPNKSGTVWHVELRRGVEFHNGKDLTADDVIYTLRRNMTDKRLAYGKNSLSIINAARTKKTGKYSLDIGFKDGVAVFPVIAFEIIGIMPKGGTDFRRNTIGSGPFKYKSFTPGNRSVFARNANYWGGAPYLDELEIISFTDKTAKLNAFLSGQTHGSDAVTPAQARQHRNNSRVRLLRAKGAGGSPSYTMRVDKEPFNDVRVRQAMKLAIDRKAVVERVYLGFATIANDVYGANPATYNGDKLPKNTYNPTRARQLLRDAGHASGLKFTTSTVEPNDVMLQVFKQSARAAGIDIDIEVVDAAKGGTLYLQQEFGQTNWGASSIESFYTYNMTKDGQYNETHTSDEKLVAMIEKANATFSPNKRRQLLFEIQKRFQATSGYIIPAFPEGVDALSPRVKGMKPHISAGFGFYDFKKVWLD